jgi:ABC-type dipeptide/oligopeptide/nickel transport system permease subunit
MRGPSVDVPADVQTRTRNPGTSFGGMIFRFVKRYPVGGAMGAVIVLLIFSAIAAPVLSPYDPIKIAVLEARQGPSPNHWIGTDYMGRDLLSRVIYGARISLFVSVTVVVMSTALAMALGVASGYIGGRFDMITQRIMEVILAFPGLVLALALLTAMGAGVVPILIALTVVRIPATTRVTRSVALAVKEYPYVEAARAIGASHTRIMLRHVAPQTVAPVLVLATASLGTVIIAEASLGFLGLGIPPPTPTWGNLLGGVVTATFKPLWWLVVFPGIAIVITVLAFNLLGDNVRDAVDPRLRGT